MKMLGIAASFFHCNLFQLLHPVTKNYIQKANYYMYREYVYTKASYYIQCVQCVDENILRNYCRENRWCNCLLKILTLRLVLGLKDPRQNCPRNEKKKNDVEKERKK